MIAEQGRVVAVEAGAAWVETERKSMCSACSARHGCGQRAMDRLNVRSTSQAVKALVEQPVAVGDAVVVGVREEALLHGVLLVYLFPLLALFAAALLADWLGGEEPVTILSGLSGFGLSWMAVAQWSRRRAADGGLQPIVLEGLPKDSHGALRTNLTGWGKTSDVQ